MLVQSRPDAFKAIIGVRFKTVILLLFIHRQYNAFNVYRRELAPGTVCLAGDRAQGDDSKHWAYSMFYWFTLWYINAPYSQLHIYPRGCDRVVLLGFVLFAFGWRLRQMLIKVTLKKFSLLSLPCGVVAALKELFGFRSCKELLIVHPVSPNHVVCDVNFWYHRQLNHQQEASPRNFNQS